jgi:hypothetical protein
MGDICRSPTGHGVFADQVTPIDCQLSGGELEGVKGACWPDAVLCIRHLLDDYAPLPSIPMHARIATMSPSVGRVSGVA